MLSEETKKHIPSDKDLSDISSSQKRPTAKSLAHYHKKYKIRNEAICAAFDSGGYSMKDIGDFFELHYSRISQIVKSGSE